MARRKKKSSPPRRAVSSSASASAQSNPPSFFEKLPPEIRNAIYELSYTSDEPLKIKKIRLTRTFMNTSIQMCAINHLMVSKQWFNEVAPVFARRTSFSLANFSPGDMVKLVCSLPAYLKLNITAIHCRTRSWPASTKPITQTDVKVLSKALPSLKNFQIDCQDFLVYGHGAWAVGMTINCQHIPWVKAVQCFRGLIGFKLVSSDMNWGEANSERVAELEESIRAEVTKAKGT